MKCFAFVLALVLASSVAGQDNPAGRQIGPDGKPLLKAADPTPAPTPDPSPVPVVAVQSWTEFLVALTAALAAIGALIQGLRNGSKAAAIHETVKALAPPDPVILPTATTVYTQPGAVSYPPGQQPKPPEAK